MRKHIQGIALGILWMAFGLSGPGADAGKGAMGFDIVLSPSTPIHCPGESRVYRTALEELASVLKAEPDKLRIHRQDSVPAQGIYLALLQESEAAKPLISAGKINLHNADPAADAYEVVASNGVLYILGKTPRGLLQGVYRLQEWTAFHEKIPGDLHLRGTFALPMRIFHQRFDRWPGERADIRYISYLGATHCLVTHDWQGNLRHLQGYVASDIFPDAADWPAVAQNRRQLRKLLDDCADYGLEAALWITELPCQGGPWVPEAERQRFLSRYPGDALSDSGTYEGKVLCFSHPRVQAYYRDLIGAFFREFPEISILFVFGLDSGGEFCDPATCPRCQGMSRFEQRDRLLKFLIEEGRKVRPGLRVLTTGWGWASSDADEFLRRQQNLPPASGLYLAAQNDGWQPERQSHDFLREARRVCSRQDQLFIGYDDFHWGDDSVHGLNDIQDYPLGIGAKIRRWYDLRADGVFDHWGAFSEDISSNSIALREFFLNPLADPEAVCREVALKQFGPKAGPSVFRAWQSLEKAHRILSNYSTWCPGQWPGWYAGRNFAPLPEEWSRFRIGPGLPEQKAGPVIYNEGPLAKQLQGVCDAWRKAFPFYLEAARWMEKAFRRAEDRPPGYRYLWPGQGTPSQKEHIRRQKIYIEAVAYAGLEIGLHFGLQAVYEQTPGDPERYRRLADPLLREDRDACIAAARYFEGLKSGGDIKGGGVSEWPALYRKKAAAIQGYLEEKREFLPGE